MFPTGTCTPTAFRQIAAKASIEALAEAEPITSDRAYVLKCVVEADYDASIQLLTPALRPPGPTVASFTVYDVQDSRVGAFTLVLEQVLARAIARSRAVTQRAWITSESAAVALAAGWGLRADLGNIVIERTHGRSTVEVLKDGVPAVTFGGRHMSGIAGEDIAMPATYNPVILPGERPAFAQMEPEFELRNCRRGLPFAAWSTSPAGLKNNDLRNGVVAVDFDCAFQLNPVRYVTDPFADVYAAPIATLTSPTVEAR